MKRLRMAGIAALGLVLVFGAMAYAHGGGFWGFGRPMGMGHMMGYGQGMYGRAGEGYRSGHCGNFRGQGQRFGEGVPRDRSLQEIPAELRDKMESMQRAQLELRLALTDKPLDESKVRELHDKVLELREEMARWHFDQNLKTIQEDKSPD